MATVGIRELRAKLSRYLQRVRQGEIVEITDRGMTVARIVPAGVPEPIERLIGDGRARWSGRRPTIPRPVELRPGARPTSELISEDRD